jgi:ribosomal protein S18 acetylase RimI-like enzyme
VILRQLLWPADRAPLERLDTSFDTEVVYDVHQEPSGFALAERPVSPAVHKRYVVRWDEEVAAADTAIVAERDGSIAGVATMQYAAWNRRAIVTHLYVDRVARGATIGRSLLAALRTRAIECGARCLWIETQNVNAPAIRFYQRCGFTVCGLDTSLYEDPAETAIFLTLPFELTPPSPTRP